MSRLFLSTSVLIPNYARTEPNEFPFPYKRRAPVEQLFRVNERVVRIEIPPPISIDVHAPPPTIDEKNGPNLFTAKRRRWTPKMPVLNYAIPISFSTLPPKRKKPLTFRPYMIRFVVHTRVRLNELSAFVTTRLLSANRRVADNNNDK